MVVRSKISDADILKWHDILEDFYTSKMTRQEFCEKNGLSYNEFNQYHSRIFYKSMADPIAHENLIKHVQSPEFQSMNIRNYVAKYKVERSQLREAQRFLYYKNLIQEGRPKSMLSLLVCPVEMIASDLGWSQDAIPPMKHEKRNLEIISGTGIRVSISEHTSAHNIAKIIECLNEIHD